MTLKQTVKNYKKVQKALAAQGSLQLPSLENKQYDFVAVETESVADLEQVYTALYAFQPTEGWLGFQSINQHFRNSILPIEAEYGVLLNAEMMSHRHNADHYALHLRYDGRSQWIISRYHYRIGKKYIADCVKHLSADDTLPSLQYRRFWQHHEQQGTQPFLACFMGFGG